MLAEGPILVFDDLIMVPGALAEEPYYDWIRVIDFTTLGDVRIESEVIFFGVSES